MLRVSTFTFFPCFYVHTYPHNLKIAIIFCPNLIDILIIFLPLNGLLTLWFGDTKVNFKINYTITYVAITEHRANRLWVRTITFS